jgi:hypothetical protein
VVLIPGLEQLHDLSTPWIVCLDAFDALNGIATAKREETINADYGAHSVRPVSDQRSSPRRIRNQDASMDVLRAYVPDAGARDAETSHTCDRHRHEIGGIPGASPSRAGALAFDL